MCKQRCARRASLGDATVKNVTNIFLSEIVQKVSNFSTSIIFASIHVKNSRLSLEFLIEENLGTSLNFFVHDFYRIPHARSRNVKIECLNSRGKSYDKGGECLGRSPYYR